MLDEDIPIDVLNLNRDMCRFTIMQRSKFKQKQFRKWNWAAVRRQHILFTTFHPSMHRYIATITTAIHQSATTIRMLANKFSCWSECFNWRSNSRHFFAFFSSAIGSFRSELVNAIDSLNVCYSNPTSYQSQDAFGGETESITLKMNEIKGTGCHVSVGISSTSALNRRI